MLAVALHEYRLYGYEGRLLLAASLMAKFGEKAWPVLSLLAKSGRTECECFVPVIARLRGVAWEDRMDALLDLSRSPDPSTKERAKEFLEALETAEGLIGSAP